MRFSGPYADWAEAAREGSYDEASILARVLEATTLALHTGVSQPCIGSHNDGGGSRAW